MIYKENIYSFTFINLADTVIQSIFIQQVILRRQ